MGTCSCQVWKQGKTDGWATASSWWLTLAAALTLPMHLSLMQVPVVGQSQFMDSPGREPGVTMMDWRTGNGTAKYWTTRLVIDSVSVGDHFQPTAVAPSALQGSNATPPVFAQAWIRHGTSTRQVLVVNKRNANATVTVAGATWVRIVDEYTGEQAPRSAPVVADTVELGPYATAVVTVAS